MVARVDPDRRAIACGAGRHSALALLLGGEQRWRMRDDGEHSPETRQLQSRRATLRHAVWQSLTPVAGLELAHRNFDCALGVTPIGGVTQSSCEIVDSNSRVISTFTQH